MATTIFSGEGWRKEEGGWNEGEGDSGGQPVEATGAARPSKQQARHKFRLETYSIIILIIKQGIDIPLQLTQWWL